MTAACQWLTAVSLMDPSLVNRSRMNKKELKYKIDEIKLLSLVSRGEIFNLASSILTTASK